MKPKVWRAAAMLMAAAWATGCAGPGKVKVAPVAVNATVTVKTDADAALAAASGATPAPEWRRTELYFGLRRADEAGGEEDRGAWSEARWQRFLDEEMTPEFPAGFSVVDAYGQWQSSRDGKIYGLISKVVVILHPATPDDEARIERVRAKFKTLTDQESVLRGTQPATVTF
jgi:hypothetical protein